VIPIKLKMRNFMCYRDNVPPLYLDGIHTACICGDNGHGKSALVDAMTWALWGKTRAKSDDDLINLGQPEMEVEFDFAVGQQPYRIIRKHSRPKRRRASGQSSLDLFIASDNGFRVISGDRIAQTQQKIISLLHMDYDTFINSAFLRQGQADQFTKQPPVKRKQVLADILGLSFYDELEEQAKELAKQQESESTQLNTAIQDIDNELGQLPTYQAELETAQSQLTQIESVIKEHESRDHRDLHRVDRRQRQMCIRDRVKDHAVIQSRIKELEATSQKLPLYQSELQQIQTQLSQLVMQEETLNQKRQACQELQARVHYLESNNAQLEQEIREIEEKLDLLVTRSGAKCPLCETDLGIDGIERIKTKYDADMQSKSGSQKANQDELAGKNVELESVKNEVLQLETKLNQDKASAQSRASILTQQITEAEEATNRLNEEGKRLTEIEQRLAGKDFAHIEQEALHQLEDELTKLDYEPHRHEEVRQDLANLEQYENQKLRLEEAERLINQEKEETSKAEEAAQELRRNLESDNQKGQDLALEINSLPQIVNELNQAEAEHQALLTQQHQSQEMIWSAKEKIKRCFELEIKRKEKEKLLGQLSKEEKIYQELAQAFGKRGIQALLIEMALPEIETEANKLLGRMTDNRMHVKIETQRETKKGDLMETLDINISDELGMRSYEMFSGGEAFRINFAIRIALSKLLAKRAGAPLPTLIVDEGFGTQDSLGLEKIKEAINSIQEDFDKLLIITHLDELKDAFPTRIDVVKTAEGSTLEMS